MSDAKKWTTEHERVALAWAELPYHSHDYSFPWNSHKNRTALARSYRESLAVAAAEKARADAAEMRVSSLMEAHGLKDAPAKQPAASLVESAEVVDAAVRVHVVPRALACWLHCRDEAQARAIRARLLVLASDEGGT